MRWLVAGALLGCGGSARLEPPAPAAAEAGEPLRGRLVHEPIEPGAQSVEAYLGIEFFLEVDGGRIDLRPTEAVPAEALAALAGRRVELTGATRPGVAPPPELAAPLGPDGLPLLQGGGFAVASVRPL